MMGWWNDDAGELNTGFCRTRLSVLGCVDPSPPCPTGLTPSCCLSSHFNDEGVIGTTR